MKKFVMIVVAGCLLSACGDPLDKVDKLSSVELAEDVGTVGAIPDAAEVAREGGLFSGLFNRDPKPEALAIAPASSDAAVNAALGVVESSAETVAAAQVNIENAVAVEPEKVAAITATAPKAEIRPRRGLFGLLGSARAKGNATPERAEATIQTASLGGTVIQPRMTEKRKPRRKRNSRKHKGPDAQIVAFGTTLPPGVVARVCDLPSGRLGKQVERFPQRGKGYTLIDSKPGASGTRPFYITGFDDNCARTFTAALALFGTPTMHEQLRYGLPSSVQPYSTTDKAYEGIKRSVCGVSGKQGCGARMSKLEKNTVFVSSYDRIGSNAQWSNILLHDGWVLAKDRKG